MAITDWPTGEQPREKLLAQELIIRFGARLLAASEAEFCAIPGMGQAKYVQPSCRYAD